MASARLHSLLVSLAVLTAAVVLTVIFWQPLWTGGGLIGGDIYYYFLPQKALYAENLKAGVIPLWNNRGGFGYPTVGESQTGVFYPPNLLLYRLLETHAAFSASLLLHYVLAFTGAWCWGRRLPLRGSAATLMALIYTYGWFAPRISLEWTIVGGAWLPWALCLAQDFFETRRWRYFAGLSFVLALQMLAGHFMIGFITQLTLLTWAPLWLWANGPYRQSATPRAGNTRVSEVGRGLTAIAVALALGFLLASIQLLPTWELKQRSQRDTVTKEHDPGYGYLPPAYLGQIVAPWHYYASDEPFRATLTVGGSRSNQVEAHLYFGLLSLPLILVGAVVSLRIVLRRDALDPQVRAMAANSLTWLGLGLIAAVYSTGLLLPLTGRLPGFSFFEGPGRYGIITTLAAGLLAGVGLQTVLNQCGGGARWLLLAVVFPTVTSDLWLVSRAVSHASLIDHAPLPDLPKSELRRVLTGDAPFGEPARLLTPATNAATLMGASVWPPYLGLGPAEYYDPELRLADPLPFEQPPTTAQRAWIQRTGISHLLLLRRANLADWPIANQPEKSALRLVNRFVDPVLNRVLATPEPLFLYALNDSAGRIAWASGGRADAQIKFYGVHRVEIATNRATAGRLILRDLQYPGWEVEIDGHPAEARLEDSFFRAVDVPAGRHTVLWAYRPKSVWIGCALSGLAVAVILLLRLRKQWWR